MQQSDIAPELVFIQPVQAVAGAHATFASGADIQVDSKGILLSFAGDRTWDQIAVVARVCWKRVRFMPTREALHRCQALLFIKQVVYQRSEDRRIE